MVTKLLGHNGLQNTLLYLYVTNPDMQKIISPFDVLNFKKPGCIGANFKDQKTCAFYTLTIDY